MAATLLIAAHGTVSAVGSATTRALVDAVAAARPGLQVKLCFLDVAVPTLADTLDALDVDVVVVPLLLSAGYHVATDIPKIVEGRGSVRVARHLGPDPLIIGAARQRLTEAAPAPGAHTVLAAIESSRESAREEVELARHEFEIMLGRPVALLPLSSDMVSAVAELPTPVAVAVYLLAEGTFLSGLVEAVSDRGVVAAPLGVHPLLVQLILDRYDETVAAR